MFIEPGCQRTVKLRRSETVGFARDVRCAPTGAIDFFSARYAINIWPLCGQARFEVRTLKIPHEFAGQAGSSAGSSAGVALQFA
jgi:hypothetical protein